MNSSGQPKTLWRSVQVTLQNYGVAFILTLILLSIFILWWIQWCLFYVIGIVFVTSLVAQFVEDWRPKPKVSRRGKAVFISGCDSGFGYSLAQRLDGLGLHVFAGCLFPEKSGAESLRNSCSERLHVLPLDVTSEESVNSAVKYVAENIGDKKFWALVNNAGIAKGGETAWTSVELTKMIFEVNTFGVMRLTKAFLPLLHKEKGRIVTVASTAGRFTLPGSVPYCMSKHAVVSFCEGLRIEMYRFGVKFITIEPWFYKTPLTDRKANLRHMTKAWEESPQEFRDMYPEGYFEKYKHSVNKLIMWTISHKPQEVTSCLEEAILAVDPKYVYSPMNVFARICFWFFYRLPKPILDAFLHHTKYESDVCVK